MSKDKLVAILFVTLIALEVLSVDANPSMKIITNRSTCSLSCDGSARIIHNNQNQTLLYEWMDENNDIVKSSYFPKADDLCAGDYKVRIIKKRPIDYTKSSYPKSEEMLPIKIFEFSAINEMKISLGFDIKAEKFLKRVNDNIIVKYSIDQGNSWKNCGALNPFKSNISGITDLELFYTTILPSYIDGKPNVLVMIAAKNPSVHKKIKKSIRNNSFDIFHIYRKYLSFSIQAKKELEVSSSISHELMGNDGVIMLDVSGGVPPYTFNWNIGSNLNSIGKLSTGKYYVEISDAMNCTIAKEFFIKPASTNDVNSLDISITPTEIKGFYRFNIRNIYDKFIYLYVNSKNQNRIKKFFVHPLNKDISVKIDLTSLQRGRYEAEFVVENETKSQPFIVR